MPLFSRLKKKGAQPARKSNTQPDLTNGKPVAPVKPRWEASWSSKTVDPAEVEDLIHACTAEMKSRAEALDTPFLLLPFRPGTDPSGARTFIRNFYKSNQEGSRQFRGTSLQQELRLTEPIVLCSIMKWCWSRMPGGVVTWPVYEGFQIGERESNMARNAFDTFIPIGAGSEARRNIIFDFFDLLCAIAAHGKMNGLGGRKLSRLAGWWAFEHSDDGQGFEGGYKSWTKAADASSHLFFAYLRTLSPEADTSMALIERIPRSLQALLAQTEYPPETPALLQRSTPRVVMLVDSVSPTPFALLRRAKHFEYRDNDRVLREFSEFEDPIDGLTDENKRVLYAISTTNSAAVLSRHGPHGNVKTGEESWSAFQNMGFSDIDQNAVTPKDTSSTNGSVRPPGQPLRAQPRSRPENGGRPTTPSWADFLSAGFSDEDLSRAPATLSLPHDKVLPPIGSRTQTPNHVMNGTDEHLAPGEMAAITNIELDDAFWWVWMTSLASEEPSERKAVFGRCALVETTVMHGRWLIMEEQVKGASPDPAEDAYIAPKKSSIFSFTKRGKNKRTKSDKPSPSASGPPGLERTTSATPSKSSLAPDQTNRIKAAAAVLARKNTDQDVESVHRRGRHDDVASVKTSSVLTMGMMNDASPAMKWAHAYDKKAIRQQYLGDTFAGKGSREDLASNFNPSSVHLATPRASSIAPSASTAPILAPGSNAPPAKNIQNRDLPAVPKEQPAVAGAEIEDVTPGGEPAAPSTMPPKSPEINVVPADAEEAQHEAQEVPLPETTQAESSDPLGKEAGIAPPKHKVGRKPVPRSDNLDDHPAFRQRNDQVTLAQMLQAENAESAAQPAQEQPQSPQSPQNPQSPQHPAAVAAQRAMDAKAESSSFESLQKQPQGKLKKQGGGGLKKLFGRKEKPNRNSLDVARPSSNGLTPPSESNFGRRLSLMRKKPGSRATPPNANHIAAAQPAPETLHAPVTLDSHGAYEHTATDDMSHVDSRSDANADEEFGRFDQGPVEDMPAATPRTDEDVETFDKVHAPTPQRHFNTELASRIAPERQQTDDAAFVTPMEHEAPAVADDAQSEASMEAPQPLNSENDRWAKIRENAAKRATRASEEQSVQSRPSQSMRETDDGETSGEETIESRVARIKARVAELTGNIDSGDGSGNVRR